MRNTAGVLLLLAGVGAGVGLTLALRDGENGRTAGRTSTLALKERERIILENNELIAQLRDRIAELERQLANRAEPEEANPYPDDTPEKVEDLLQAAYAENNIDWMLEIIERLLLMGERGYPMLRRIIMDIVFSAQFRPSQSDFRFDQIYTAGRIFTKHERQFIGFLNYLLTDPQTNGLLKQGAVPVAAFYVGSKAPGSEQLSETLLQMFLAQGGGGIPSNFLLGNMGKRMQIFAMAMSGDPKMVEPLRDELDKTKDKRLQGEILGAMAYLGDSSTLPLIKDRLDPAGQDDFRNEVRALGRLGTEEAHNTAMDFVRAIPDSKRFYRHAATYIRSGGGDAGIKLIKERIQEHPEEKEVSNVIRSLRRFPSAESRDTLRLIAETNGDQQVAKRAGEAAEEVDRRLRGELPPMAQLPR